MASPFKCLGDEIGALNRTPAQKENTDVEAGFMHDGKNIMNFSGHSSAIIAILILTDDWVENKMKGALEAEEYETLEGMVLIQTFPRDYRTHLLNRIYPARRTIVLGVLFDGLPPYRLHGHVAGAFVVVYSCKQS